jgi:hypothetical protein
MVIGLATMEVATGTLPMQGEFQAAQRRGRLDRHNVE